MAYDKDKPLNLGVRHEPLVLLADLFTRTSQDEVTSARVNAIYKSGNTAEAVAFLTQHRVSLAASLEHLGITYEDLKNHVALPEMGLHATFPVNFIKSVRAATGWGLAPAIWILKLLAMANIFFSDAVPEVNNALRVIPVADAETEAFKQKMLALGVEVEVNYKRFFTPT